jgi:hypothetical protein
MNANNTNFKIQFLAASDINGTLNLPHNLGLEYNSCDNSNLQFFLSSNNSIATQLNVGQKFSLIKYYPNRSNGLQAYNLELENGEFFLEKIELIDSSIKVFNFEIVKKDFSKSIFLKIKLMTPRIGNQNDDIETKLMTPRIGNQNDDIETKLMTPRIGNQNDDIETMIQNLDVDFLGKQMKEPIVFNGDMNVFFGLQSIVVSKNDPSQDYKQFLNSWKENISKYF